MATKSVKKPKNTESTANPSVKKSKHPEGVTRGKETILIPFAKLEVEPDYNKRINYPRIPELVESIRENGVKIPLVVKKSGDKYIIRGGHRRYKALKTLVDSGFDVGKIPCTPQGKDVSPEQEIVDMFVYNDGEPFSQLEQGLIFDELHKRGYTEKDIQKKLGLSHVNEVYDGLKLAHTPKRIHISIRDNKISSTAVLQIIKDCKHEDGVDYEKAMQMVEKAVVMAEKDPTNKSETKKATARHVKGLRDKTPIQKMFSAVERAEKKEANFDMRKVVFLREIAELLKKKVTEDDILELLRKKTQGK